MQIQWNTEIWKKYKNQTKPITEAKEAIILRDFTIQTDRKIRSYWPDIVIKDFKRQTSLLYQKSGPTDKTHQSKNVIK